MPYKELYDWSGCAELVADYLNYEPLDPPYELVRDVFLSGKLSCECLEQNR
jgi:hypothetical protein